MVLLDKTLVAAGRERREKEPGSGRSAGKTAGEPIESATEGSIANEADPDEIIALLESGTIAAGVFLPPIGSRLPTDLSDDWAAPRPLRARRAGASL